MVDQPIVRILIISVSYFFAVYLSFLFPDLEKIVMAIWPAGGIGLAALLLNPRRLWPAILIGIFIAGNSANLIIGRPIFNSIGFMSANIMESLAGALFITWWCGHDVNFSRIREIIALLITAFLINACTAIIGAGTAYLAHFNHLWGFWRTWVIADGLGILVVTPLIVTFLRSSKNSFKFSRSSIIEWVIFIALWCSSIWWIFSSPNNINFIGPHPYLILVLLSWPAMRFGPRGVAVGLFLLTLIISTSNAVSAGPLMFGGANSVERLLSAQIFIIFSAISGFLLASSYNELKSSEQIISESQKQYSDLVERTMDLVTRVDKEGRIIFINSASLKIYGLRPEECIGRLAFDFISPEDRERTIAAFNTWLKSDKDNIVFENQQVHIDGKVHLMSWKIFTERNVNGRVNGFSGYARDITERKIAEDKIKSLLEEKEIMLREVNHRIKNNMNTLYGLLLLQSQTLEDSKAVTALESSASRVHSMMVLYDKLYHSLDVQKLSVKDYLPSLIDEILANGSLDKSVKIEKNIDDFILDAKRLQPLGIIINELLSNIIKYAFNGIEGGVIKVSATLKNDMVSISVEDNGNGIPETVDFDNSTGFGLQLVGMLAKDLKGTIRIERASGTKIILEFKF